jgi:hypothetical protein
LTKYFCTKCEKHHHRGKIYQEHQDFKREKVLAEEPINNESILYDFDSLRPVAKRQILKLIKKMKKSTKPEIYKKQIEKVIQYETKNY